MSEVEFGVFVKDTIANIDKRPFAFIEVKSGTAQLTAAQGALLAELIAAGKGDIFVLYNLPQRKIRPTFLADSVEAYLTHKGRNISAEERKLVMRLSEQMQKSLPPELSAGEAFLYTLVATSALIGLNYAWVDE